MTSSERGKFRIRDADFSKGGYEGKMFIQECNIDFRKGMLSVLQADDQLMHLQWKDRGTGTVEVSSYVYASQMSS